MVQNEGKVGGETGRKCCYILRFTLVSYHPPSLERNGGVPILSQLSRSYSILIDLGWGISDFRLNKSI